jgi:phenylacetate-CoA ligase
MKIASRISKVLAPPLFKIAGSDIFGLWRWIEHTESWDRHRREEWRLQRLGDLIEHCWDNVPFYREFWSGHGVKTRRPRSLNELKEFPTVSRDIFREHRQRIIADNLRTIPHKNESTGGTTGSPLQYKQDLSAHSLRYAFAWRWWRSIGYRFGSTRPSLAKTSRAAMAQPLSWRFLPVHESTRGKGLLRDYSTISALDHLWLRVHDR